MFHSVQYTYNNEIPTKPSRANTFSKGVFAKMKWIMELKLSPLNTRFSLPVKPCTVLFFEIVLGV